MATTKTLTTKQAKAKITQGKAQPDLRKHAPQTHEPNAEATVDNAGPQQPMPTPGS